MTSICYTFSRVFRGRRRPAADGKTSPRRFDQEPSSMKSALLVTLPVLLTACGLNGPDAKDQRSDGDSAQSLGLAGDGPQVVLPGPTVQVPPITVPYGTVTG